MFHYSIQFTSIIGKQINFQDPVFWKNYSQTDYRTRFFSNVKNASSSAANVTLPLWSSTDRQQMARNVIRLNVGVPRTPPGGRRRQYTEFSFTNAQIIHNGNNYSGFHNKYVRVRRALILKYNTHTYIYPAIHTYIHTYTHIIRVYPLTTHTTMQV